MLFLCWVPGQNERADGVAKKALGLSNPYTHSLYTVPYKSYKLTHAFLIKGEEPSLCPFCNMDLSVSPCPQMHGFF